MGYPRGIGDGSGPFLGLVGPDHPVMLIAMAPVLVLD